MYYDSFLCFFPFLFGYLDFFINVYQKKMIYLISLLK